MERAAALFDEAFGLEYLGGSKVGKHELEVFVEQQVGGLQVAVDDLLAAEVAQNADELTHVVLTYLEVVQTYSITNWLVISSFERG